MVNDAKVLGRMLAVQVGCAVSWEEDSVVPIIMKEGGIRKKGQRVKIMKVFWYQRS